MEFDSTDLRELVHGEMEGKPDARLRKKLLGLVELTSPDSSRELFRLLREKPKVDLTRIIRLASEKKAGGVVVRKAVRPK